MNNDYEKVISFDSLLKAHKKARLSKQHKEEVIDFELNLSENLWALHYELKYKKYQIGKYRKFKIKDPKEREIQAISYRDRIVQHSLCDNLLIPILEKHLIDTNCACRKNKGTSYAIKKLRSFMTSHYKKYGNSGYFIKLDIHKYFPSINHEVLMEKLKPFHFSADVMYLLKLIINSFPENNRGMGLPMGNQTSQCFALLYLDKVDRYIKEGLQVKYYVRYMDDMILLVKDKMAASKYIRLIAIKIRNEKIVLNPKSSIIPVTSGIEFLGWRF